VDGNGWTPLHFAARFHHVGAIEELIALGASLEAKDSDGRTPLDHARNSINAARKQEAVAALERLCGAPTDGAPSWWQRLGIRRPKAHQARLARCGPSGSAE
jgi:ankyrin repeat protein